MITFPRCAITLNMRKVNSKGTFSFHIAGQDYLDIIVSDNLIDIVVSYLYISAVNSSVELIEVGKSLPLF